MKRFTSLIMSVLLLILALSGCATQTVNTKVTRLKYVMPGVGTQEDSKVVWEEFNRRLQTKLPNVEVEFEVIPLAEYKQKFMLMVAGRETIDIANQYALDFATEVSNGTFAPLDELLQTHGKEVKNALPEWLFNYTRVNEKIYGIPSYQMCGTYRGFNFIKEYADKYLDVEKFKKALYSSNLFNREVFTILEDYLAALKADGITFKTAPWINQKGFDQILGHYGVVVGDDSCKVSNMYISDYMKDDHYARVRKWYEKGYIREDNLTAKDTNNFIGKKDGVPFWDAVYTPYVAANTSKKYGMEILTIPYEDSYYLSRTNSAAGTGIMAASKNQVEAMQLLNLLQSDKELYNLLVYGLEDVHYKKIGDDRIETVSPSGQATANDKYGLYKWIIGNTELAYDHQLEPDGYKNWVFNEVNSSEWKSPLIGFVPDTSKITNLITQVDGLTGEYYLTIASGAVENWETLFNEWREKVNLAGNDKIIEELQRQIDEFLKNKK